MGKTSRRPNRAARHDRKKVEESVQRAAVRQESKKAEPPARLSRQGLAWSVIDSIRADGVTAWSAAEDDPLIALPALDVVRDELDRFERTAVARARRRGATWSQVGQASGVTRSAAQQRFTTLTRRQMGTD